MALVIAGTITLAMPRVSEFLAVDACLDEGGSYDHVKGECDYMNNHPYPPGSPRRPLPAASPAGKPLVAAGALLLLGAIVVVVRDRTRTVGKPS
jgi:hypothetical protein